jgi:hypothetical protein
MENQFPKIRVFLLPVMSSITRSALTKIQTFPDAEKLPNREQLFLQIVRSAFDLHQINTLRIRQGLKMLMDVLKLTPDDLERGLKNTSLLSRHGIIRPEDETAQALGVLGNFVKTIERPAAHVGMIPEHEKVEPIKKKEKPTLSGYEMRRLKEKEEQMLKEQEEEAERLRILRERRKELRKRNPGTRYLSDSI